MIPWYLKPTNWLLMILGAAVLYFGSGYLIQRTTIAKQAGTIIERDATITKHKATIAGLNGQVADYKRQIKAQKALAAQQQEVANSKAVLLERIEKIEEGRCLHEKDDQLISDIVYFFNYRRLRLETGNSGTAASGKVLSAPDQAGDAGLFGWTNKKLIKALAICVGSHLEHENCIDCYEKE